MSATRILVPALAIAITSLAACGGNDTPADTGNVDAARDSSPADDVTNDTTADAAADADAASDAATDGRSDVVTDVTTDAGDGGDAGGAHPVAVGLVVDLQINRVGHGMLTGSYAGVRAPGWASDLTPGTCHEYISAHDLALPSIGDVVFSNLAVSLQCGVGSGNLFGFDEYRCVPSGDTPAGVGGSPLSGTALLGTSGGRVQVTGGSAIYTATAANPAPPTAGVTLTAPTTLPAMFSDDLTVTWTPIGSTDVLVELEVFGATPASYGTVVCHPATDGTMTIPRSSTLTGMPARLSVIRYTEARGVDAAGRQLSLLLGRGAAIAN